MAVREISPLLQAAGTNGIRDGEREANPDQTGAEQPAELPVENAQQVLNPSGSPGVAVPETFPIPTFVTAPGAGTVFQLHVAVDDNVLENDAILTLTLNDAVEPVQFTAPIGGRVCELPAAPGRRVAANAYIAAII
ncbi:g5003 [Coccomyxa elongata]